MRVVPMAVPIKIKDSEGSEKIKVCLPQGETRSAEVTRPLSRANSAEVEAAGTPFPHPSEGVGRPSAESSRVGKLRPGEGLVQAHGGRGARALHSLTACLHLSFPTCAVEGDPSEPVLLQEIREPESRAKQPARRLAHRRRLGQRSCLGSSLKSSRST